MPTAVDSVRIAALLIAFLQLAAPALARPVTVPVALDHAFLRQALIQQVYTDPDQTARVWNDGSGCNYLTLSAPQVDSDTGRVRVTSAGEARVGTAVGQQCLVLLNWKGSVQIYEEPRVTPGVAVVRFAVVDSQLFGPNGRKQATGVIWDWVKQYVHPRLEMLTVDLQPALLELGALLPTVLPSEDVQRTQQLLDSLTLQGVQPTATGVTATLAFDVPDRVGSEATDVAAPEPTLSRAELDAWDAAWQSWDSFLVFVVKIAALDSGTTELSDALFEVLIEARYDLLEALAPTEPHETDPVLPLFLRTWERLAPVLRRLSSDLPGAAAARYLGFVAAGDALVAIDELGPAVGFDLSSDGLRRLARIVAPATAEDPVEYRLDVDPVLRRALGFGEPLPPPEENPDIDLSAWLFSRAWAAAGPDRAVLNRLKNWVPSRDELDQYLPIVRDVLAAAAARTLSTRTLASEFHDLYRWLVLSAAWQESCWRQFLKVGGKVYPIKSPAGSVGIMQVNQNVWRGFYDLKGLQTDISYNANAGSEILLEYLVKQAIAKGEHKATGKVDNLARATYAVYNAGPGELRRYRRAKVAKRARRVDDAFWHKYQTIKSGDELAVAECYGR